MQHTARHNSFSTAQEFQHDTRVSARHKSFSTAQEFQHGTRVPGPTQTHLVSVPSSSPVSSPS
jgi:hypothetical protein